MLIPSNSEILFKSLSHNQLWNWCNIGFFNFRSDIKFYFHITGRTQLALAWLTTSSSYNNVEISYTPAGDRSTMPVLPIANGGGFVNLEDEQILLNLQITVKDNGSNEKRMPPIYVDFNNAGKFCNILLFLFNNFLPHALLNFRKAN